jgi:hypothetical protein
MRYLTLLLALLWTTASRASLAWTPADSTPAPTGRSAIGQVGRYVYLFGGGPDGTAAYAYDCSTGHWVPSTPHPLGARFNWTGVVAQGRVYVLGGSDSLHPQSDMYAFLPDSEGNGTWVRQASLPRPLALLGAAALGDSLIITAGGLTYLGYATSQCFCYHIAQDWWDTLPLPALPQARIAGGLVAQGGKLYALGGLDSVSRSYANTIFEYDPVANHWQTRRTLLAPIAFNHQSIASDGRFIYLVGGGAGVSLWPGSPLVQAWDPADDSLWWETPLPETVGLQSTCFATYAGGSFLLTTGGFQDSLYVSATYRATLTVGVEQEDVWSRGPDIHLTVSPNPVRTQATISLSFPSTLPPPPFTLSLYDLTGRLIRRLPPHMLQWDGRDASGRPVRNGVYVLRCESGSFRLMRTLVVLH